MTMKKIQEKELVIILYAEGDTDVEFYKKLIRVLREKSGGRLNCYIEIKNLKGIGNYKDRALRFFVKNIKIQYPPKKHRYHIFLCYDTDVFEFAKKPPVDWGLVTSALKEAGADMVEEVKAIHSIEDWFLYDIQGLRLFLKIPKKEKLPTYQGLKGLETLFRRAKKTYIKGSKCSDLVDYLDYDIILPKIKDQIQGICNALQISL